MDDAKGPLFPVLSSFWEVYETAKADSSEDWGAESHLR
jgi:hypothetical protein